MGKLVVLNNVTLDGVMQAPARPDEDRRDGFGYGGWTRPYQDAVMAERMAQGMARDRARGGGLLLGRRTYEDFYRVWPSRTDNPYTEVLNNTQKYLVSSTLAEPLPWQNSTLLAGDAAQAVARLKQQQPDRDLMILGSGALIRSLLPHQLIDEFVLMIHPLVLGSGQRLFPQGTAVALRLTDSVITTTGVVIATYQPAGPVPQAS
jgi:dihydrofolate reductase